MNKFVNEKLIPSIIKFTNLKGVIALREGMTSILSATIVGSIFLLLASFPYQPIKVFLADIGVSQYLFQVFNSTFNILALICSFTIAYSYAKHEKVDPLGCSIISLISFILVSNQYIVVDGKKITGVLSLGNSLGSRAMIASIIISLVSSYLYCWFIKKNYVIKMPDSVPEGVANSFSALIPATFILSFFVLIYGLVNYITKGDLIDLIYKLVQTPISNVTGSLPGVLFVSFLVPFLWWFGIHGNNIVTGIMSAIWLSAVAHNQEILQSGLELTIANGGKIVTDQFHRLTTMTGSGVTIGLVLAMLFRAKSKQFKQLGKLSIMPALFNINEPIIFGTPVVFNIRLFVPFVMTPVIIALVSYFAIKSGLVPLFGAIVPPWTTPPIIYGLLSGGIRTALLQLVNILISFAIYYPFFKKLDKEALLQEQKSEMGE